jgi:hypothetical protein
LGQPDAYMTAFPSGENGQPTPPHFPAHQHAPIAIARNSIGAKGDSDTGGALLSRRAWGLRDTADTRQPSVLVAMRGAGQYSSAGLDGLFGVARSTVYRAVERERLCAAVGGGAGGLPAPSSRLRKA